MSGCEPQPGGSIPCWEPRKESWICDTASVDNSRVMNQCAFRGMEENTERPKRQRQNNFPMFPSPKDWNFRGRKRKQSTQDEDAVSLCSLDISEPSNKRVKPLSRVTSLANLIPPVKATPLKRFSQTLQRSISFRSESRPDLLGPRPWSRNAAPSSTKRRDSKLWSETFDVCVNQMLTSKEIKRQEAIFELSQGEEDLIEDLKLAKKAYHDPMLKLSIMTEQELNQTMTHEHRNNLDFSMVHAEKLLAMGVSGEEMAGIQISGACMGAHLLSHV